MNESRFDSSACFICDHGLTILVAAAALGVAAYFTRNFWLPPTPTTAAAITAVAPTLRASPATLTAAPAANPTNAVWSTYNDADWRFSIKYPERSGNANVRLIKEQEEVPLGPEKKLLLSDSAGSTLQDVPRDELFRFTVWREKVKETSFDEWSARISAGLGAPLTPTNIGKCEANKIEKGETLYLLVSTSSHHFAAIAKNNKRIPEVVNSFMPAECFQ